MKKWIKSFFSCKETKTSPFVETPKYAYDVKEDITAYELYRLTTPRRFQNNKQMDEWYQGLPNNVKRHIKIV